MESTKDTKPEGKKGEGRVYKMPDSIKEFYKHFYLDKRKEIKNEKQKLVNFRVGIHKFEIPSYFQVIDVRKFFVYPSF